MWNLYDNCFDSAKQLQDNSKCYLLEADQQLVTERSEATKPNLLQIVIAYCVLHSIACKQSRGLLLFLSST